MVLLRWIDRGELLRKIREICKGQLPRIGLVANAQETNAVSNDITGAELVLASSSYRSSSHWVPTEEHIGRIQCLLVVRNSCSVAGRSSWTAT